MVSPGWFILSSSAMWNLQFAAKSDSRNGPELGKSASSKRLIPTGMTSIQELLDRRILGRPAKPGDDTPSSIFQKLRNLPHEQLRRGLHGHVALAFQHRDRAPRQNRLHAFEAGAVDRRALPAEQQQRRDAPGAEPLRAELVARHRVELA